MKRFLTILLILCLLAPSALSSESPFAPYSDDELIIFAQMAQNEIVSRGLVKSAVVPQGVYIVGLDVPAGIYSVSHDGSVSSVEVYPSATSNDDLYDYSIYGDEIIGRLELLDGQRLEVLHSAITLTVYTGLVFN